MRRSVGQFSPWEPDESWKSRRLADCTIATNESPPNQVVGIRSAHNAGGLVSVQSITLLAILDTFRGEIFARQLAARSIDGWSFQYGQVWPTSGSLSCFDRATLKSSRSIHK